jgi:hypothetical protein
MGTCLRAEVRHFGRHARLTGRAGNSQLIIIPLGKVHFMLISCVNNFILLSH